jgi:hypothetical protein
VRRSDCQPRPNWAKTIVMTKPWSLLRSDSEKILALEIIFLFGLAIIKQNSFLAYIGACICMVFIAVRRKPVQQG